MVSLFHKQLTDRREKTGAVSQTSPTEPNDGAGTAAEKTVCVCVCA